MSISRLLENIRPYFPYKEVRLKQDYVINKIYTELLESKRHIVISAPNGYGKTIFVGLIRKSRELLMN